MRIHDLIPWAQRERAPGPTGGLDMPMMALQREINRVFDDVWGATDRPFGFFGGGRGLTRAAADMVETEKAVEISIELPGLEEKDIDVSVTHDALTIKGEKKVERQEEKTGYYVAERSYGSVYRSIPLPAGVDVDNIQATVKNGVLTVSLPKTAEAQSDVHKVEVKAA